MNKRCLLSAFILLISIVSSGLAQEDSQVQNPKIFFDQSTRGFFGLQNSGPAGFSELVEDLESLGYVVNDNFMTDSNFGYLDEANLRESDIVVIINPKRSPENTETSSLMNFVGSGGNLIVICDSPESIFNSNLILKPYDIYFKQEYILNTNVNISGNRSINLGYSVPPEERKVHTDYFKTLDENPFRLKGKSEISKDLLYEEERFGEEHTILIAKNFQQGKVIALGNKDFFTNYRFNENRELFYFVLNYIECENNKEMQGLSYKPSEFSIPFKDGKISFVKLSLENKNNRNPVYGSIDVPEILKNVVVPLESNFTLGPGENLDLNFLCRNLNDEYGYVKTTIALKVWYNEFSEPYVYEIPFEVVRI